MFFRLICRIALPLVLLSLLIVGALVSFPRPVPPLTLPGFDQCPLPCWARITPGSTRYNDSARALLAAFPDAQVDFFPGIAQVNFTINTGEKVLPGWIYEDRGLVGGLRLETSVPVWQLIALLGEPACVRAEQNLSYFVNLHWQLSERMSLTALVLRDQDQRWSPASPTNDLFILHDVEACHPELTTGWRGFAPVWRYRQLTSVP